jgi:hypothetical protein
MPFPMTALALAQADAAQGKLDPEKQNELRDTIEEIIDDLSDYADKLPAQPKAKGSVAAAEHQEIADNLAPIVSKDQLPRKWQVSHPVLCIVSRRPLDEGASVHLGKHGLAA